MQNKLMLIIIIVLLLVLVAAAGAFAYFFVRSSRAQEETEIDPAPTVVYLNEDEMTDISMGDPLRTNLAISADGGEHMISVSLSISVNNTVKKESAAMLVLLEEKQQIMRSVALSVIRKKTAQELRRPDGQEILENDILSRLQEQFSTNLIVRVSAYDMIVN